MRFEEIIGTLEQAFKLKLAVVQDTTVFEAVSEDGATKVRVLVQSVDEHRRVLLSADLGVPPPGSGEQLYRTMLEANNLFTETGGATLSIDAATGACRLQRHVSQDDFAGDAEARLVAFVETALAWSRLIADHRPSAEDGPMSPEDAMPPLGSFHIIQV